MKYVALLSGGKDSCFNLLHCARNGHDLVAAASIRPPQGKEELDSYLYQTVGQDAIELVAQALDVPLYRKIISGSALEQSSEYGTREGGGSGVKGDETEDLYELLSEVKSRHPDVRGVSVGAILSNYQRVRVEHVCQRLSLTPLCYLWQRNQDELLSEMIASGLEAILIKVAGIGLQPKHLGQTLLEMQPTLRSLNDLYGSHICGEGGEYETLTIDSPLFKQRIVIEDAETVIHSDNDFATVAYLRIKNGDLVAKDATSYLPVSIPPLLMEEYQNLEKVLKEYRPTTENDMKPLTTLPVLNRKPSLSASSIKIGKWVAVSNVQQAGEPAASIGAEVAACFRILQDVLAHYHLRISDLAFVNVFISDMATFPEVNETYKTFFGSSPPSRACVAVDLPPGVNVKLDCIAYEDTSNERRALHVQGLSYWAPANIGPYSQAIIVCDQIFISGQIGMRPSNLALPSPPDFAVETALAFQHVHRILTALQETYGSHWNKRIQSLVCWLTNASHLPALRKIGEALDAYTSVPTLFIGVKALPKGALIEAQVVAHSGQYIAVEQDGLTEIRQCSSPIADQGDLVTDASTVHWEVSSSAEVSAFCTILAIKGNAVSIIEQLKERMKGKALWEQIYSARLFDTGSLSGRAFISSLLPHAMQPAVTEIPVRFISTKERDDWDFALCLIGSSSNLSNISR